MWLNPRNSRRWRLTFLIVSSCSSTSSTTGTLATGVVYGPHLLFKWISFHVIFYIPMIHDERCLKGVSELDRSREYRILATWRLPELKRSHTRKIFAWTENSHAFTQLRIMCHDQGERMEGLWSLDSCNLSRYLTHYYYQ